MVDARREGLPPKTEWRTPLWVYRWVEDYYKIEFNLDPCTSADNPLGTELFFTKETDGLKQSWAGRKVYVNPPYGARELPPWIDKAIREANRDSSDKELEIVMLLPSATDTRWFKRLNSRAEITFITGRISFIGSTSSARGGYLLAYLVSSLSNSTPETTSVELVDLPKHINVKPELYYSELRKTLKDAESRFKGWEGRLNG
jgi:phage N-6-adenine-methyltransferase